MKRDRKARERPQSSKVGSESGSARGERGTAPDSEHLIRAVLDAAVDAIITIDTDGAIKTFNKAAERMFGYTAGEAIGQNVSMLMGEPYRDSHDDYLKRYLRTGERRVIGRLREFTARRKNGMAFPIQLSVAAIPELGLFTGIVRDITDQRELQEEIVRIATDEQRRIGQELHDNTQQELTGLGLMARNLADALSETETAAERELALKIASGIAASNRRVRALSQGLVPVPVDADGLMAALSDLAGSTEARHGISCRLVCPKPVRVTDDGAALQMYRIVQEAVTNAVKHASADTITIHLEEADGSLGIEVRDDGIGIDGTARNRGGLGLRIMEHRCALLGGTLSVQRRDSGGTVVSCRVPAPHRT